MPSPKALLLSIPILALALTSGHRAAACGGCFVKQSESTQVTGHKMILSVSPSQTTLWDQIAYSGSPSSFAWVLPTTGLVTVGLSSDALFANIDQETAVTVSSPTISCPPPNCGFGPQSAGGGLDDHSADAGAGPVTVLAQNVVGPYETVQLKSSDPSALKSWLTMHGYNVPADVASIIDAYVKDNFDFLALKLVPGKDVSAMRPVRVTSPGATPVLPLRMVAAGTGVITPITLWVFGEGRYEPAKMPWFTMQASELVWNWDTASSNYAPLRTAKLHDANNAAWLIEAGEPTSKFVLQDALENLAQTQPGKSGYADDKGQGALQAAKDDLAALFGTISGTSLWVTRMHGELSRAALTTDLEIGASADQTSVLRYFQTTKTVGTPPPCATPQPCGGQGSTGSGAAQSGGWDIWTNGNGGTKAAGGGCAMMAGKGVSATLGTLVFAAALALYRARRR